MRMNKGEPFMDVEADGPPTDDWDRGSRIPPTFSEAFLYPTVGKGDARFILGVAEEYDHVIEALGPKALRLILDVKPRLCQRLGLPEAVVECLKDAESWDNEMREARSPSQVILDSDAAINVWQLLHSEYRYSYNPEESMDRDMLRAYNTLTDFLGDWAQRQRQEERDKLPEKLKKQAQRATEVVERQRIRKDKRARIESALAEFVDGDGRLRQDVRPDDLSSAIERKLREEKA